MKLVSIERDGGIYAGCEVGDDILDFALAVPVVPDANRLPATVRGLISDERALTMARSVIAQALAAADQLKASGAIKARSSVSLAAPIPDPTTILSHGQAYKSHVTDFHAGQEEKRIEHPPAGFLKSPAALTGTDTAICLPRIAPDRVDYEGEFCVVFARDCFDVKREEAMDYIAGYTIMNDVSARDWIRFIRAPETSAMPLYHALNMSYKSFPTFCPMGPNLTTKDEIGDPAHLRLITRLNGEVMQDALLSQLIWDIPTLIEYYSSMQQFKAGDILSTGTPGGVGAGRTPQVFMKAGDVIDISVDGVGTLRNTIAPA